MTPLDLILWALAITGTIILTAVTVAIVVAVARTIRAPKGARIISSKGTR